MNSSYSDKRIPCSLPRSEAVQMDESGEQNPKYLSFGKQPTTYGSATGLRERSYENVREETHLFLVGGCLDPLLLLSQFSLRAGCEDFWVGKFQCRYWSWVAQAPLSVLSASLPTESALFVYNL